MFVCFSNKVYIFARNVNFKDKKTNSNGSIQRKSFAGDWSCCRRGF